MFRRHATLVLALLLALALTTEAAKAKKRAKKSNIKNLEDGVKIEQVQEIGNLGFDTRPNDATMAKIRLMSQSRLTRIFREVGVDPAAAGGDLRKLQNLAHKENLLDRYDAIQAQKSEADSREFRKADAEMRKQEQPKQQLVLEQLWKTLDKNKDGVVTKREWMQLNELKQNIGDLDEVWKVVDRDRDNRASQEEFEQLFSTFNQPGLGKTREDYEKAHAKSAKGRVLTQLTKQLFTLVDRNRDNRLTSAELDSLKDVTNQVDIELQGIDLLEATDENDDGFCDADELDQFLIANGLTAGIYSSMDDEPSADEPAAEAKVEERVGGLRKPQVDSDDELPPMDEL